MIPVSGLAVMIAVNSLVHSRIGHNITHLLLEWVILTPAHTVTKRSRYALLKRAIREAWKSAHPHFKHATLIYRGGALVATGYNHDERHAEVVALGKLWPGDARGTTIVNVRIKSSGKVGMSRPCPRCLKILLDNRVAHILHSTPEGILQELW